MNPEQSSFLQPKHQKWVLVSDEMLSEDGPGEDRDTNTRRRGVLKGGVNTESLAETKQPEDVKVLLHRGLSGVRRSAKPIQAWLSYYNRVNAAANTAYAFAYPIQPNLDVSFASWQNVFDEMKVLSAELHWNIWWSVLPTGFATQSPNAIVVYEPGVQTPLGSVNEGMQYEHFQLLDFGGTAAGTYATAPQTVSKTGHLVFKSKMPHGVQLSVTSTTLSTGEWRPTIDAQNYYWGVFHGYVAQGGATSVPQIQAFVRMRVEFRTRR